MLLLLLYTVLFSKVLDRDFDQGLGIFRRRRSVGGTDVGGGALSSALLQQRTSGFGSNVPWLAAIQAKPVLTPSLLLLIGDRTSHARTGC